MRARRLCLVTRLDHCISGLFPLLGLARTPNLIRGKDDEGNGKEEASMPDPKECRRYALECVWLAQVPASPQAREAYLNVAKAWLRLANELGFAIAVEKSQRLIEEGNDLEYKNAS